MIPLLAGGALLGLTSAIAFALLFGKMVSRERFSDFDAEWLNNFSLAKYKPMERLFAEEDYEFLASQKGYRLEIGRKLRSQRRKVFRLYLRGLKRDFYRLERAVRMLIVSSPVDRPDLAKTLLQQRLAFMWAMFQVECRLALHTLGLGGVDISALVGSLDAMRLELAQVAVLPRTSAL